MSLSLSCFLLIVFVRLDCCVFSSNACKYRFPIWAMHSFGLCFIISHFPSSRLRWMSSLTKTGAEQAMWCVLDEIETLRSYSLCLTCWSDFLYRAVYGCDILSCLNKCFDYLSGLKTCLGCKMHMNQAYVKLCNVVSGSGYRSYSISCLKTFWLLSLK